MRLTTAQAAKLARLAGGGALPKGEFTKPLLKTLQHAGVVRLVPSGSSYLVRGIPDKLSSFIEHEWGIRDLDSFANADPENRSRESLAEIASDSKALPNRPLDGLLIRSFGNCTLHGESLGTTHPGSAALISTAAIPHLQIQAKAIIAIENVACLLNFEKYSRHFPQLKDLDFALVLRWCWGTPWKEWLRNWDGSLLYFPDYDPAGLSIFASEVLKHRANAHLLIPDNLEVLVRDRGKRDLFLKQEHQLTKLPAQSEILIVKEYIQAHRKGLEQESLHF